MSSAAEETHNRNTTVDHPSRSCSRCRSCYSREQRNGIRSFLAPVQCESVYWGAARRGLAGGICCAGNVSLTLPYDDTPTKYLSLVEQILRRPQSLPPGQQRLLPCLSPRCLHIIGSMTFVIEFKSQSTPLFPPDLVQMYSILIEAKKAGLKALSFYNCAIPPVHAIVLLY